MLKTSRFRTIPALALILFSALPGSAQSMGDAHLIRAFADDPVPSPDGSHLLYINTVSGREQLWVMRADGSDPVQLTRDSADHEDPAWSPDGRTVAYTSIHDSAEVTMLMRSDGSGARILSPRNVRAIHPAWSPNGREVLYCTDDDLRPPAKNDAQIYRVDVATGTVALVVSGGVNTYPALSPDGGMLAFRRMVGEKNSEVFVARADGSNARNLTNSDAFDGWPAWSPDGTRIAYASNRGGSSYQVFTIDRSGGDIRLVANTTGRATAPHWSPDGTQIYFTNCYRAGQGFRCDALVAAAH
jgi:TolB protein